MNPIIITSIVGVIGWIASHGFSKSRERSNRRKILIGAIAKFKADIIRTPRSELLEFFQKNVSSLAPVIATVEDDIRGSKRLKFRTLADGIVLRKKHQITKYKQAHIPLAASDDLEGGRQDLITAIEELQMFLEGL